MFCGFESYFFASCAPFFVADCAPFFVADGLDIDAIIHYDFNEPTIICIIYGKRTQADKDKERGSL